MDKPSQVHCEECASPTFERAFERHYKMIYRLCFSYIKNADDAEDVVSEVFEKLLIKKPLFRDNEHEKAWLLRTAINKCKDYHKHWWRKRTNIDDEVNLTTDGELQTEELLSIILNMPERYKAVIYLYYYEGYKTREISQILKKPESTIRNHLREAREYLKGVLENEEC